MCLNEEDTSIGDYLLEQKLVIQITDIPVESSSEEYHDVSSGENSGENEDVGVLSGKEFIENQIKCALGQFGIKEDMSDEKKLDVYLSNTFKPEAGNINEAITNYDAQDRVRTCRFAQNGTCFKGNQCKLDHEPLREGTIWILVFYSLFFIVIVLFSSIILFAFKSSLLCSPEVDYCFLDKSYGR